MKTDIVPMIAGILIIISSLLALTAGLSVPIIEILTGSVAGYFGLRAEDWMIYLASFGGIALTFLAGAEIDTKLMRGWSSPARSNPPSSPKNGSCRFTRRQPGHEWR